MSDCPLRPQIEISSPALPAVDFVPRTWASVDFVQGAIADVWFCVAYPVLSETAPAIGVDWLGDPIWFGGW